MRRILAVFSLLACATALAQSSDPRFDALARETAQLRRTVADQEKRIADLEKTVKMLQAAVNLVPSRIPPDTPSWQVAANWALIRSGMSEAQVTEILGPPVRVLSVVDNRTLYYPIGSVSLTDDRVTAALPPPAKSLQGVVNGPPPRIPSTTPAWHLASNWSLIRKGMPAADVVDILGPPTREQSVTDVRTLYYGPDSSARGSFFGTITLMDDRVTASSPPAF